jgi:hypothetical protein
VPDLSKTKFRENIPEFLFKIMYYYKIRQYWENFSFYFYKPMLPDCEANIARLA